MIRSMTAFASAKGALPPHAWSWELRSVNAKGLDLRLRVPDWLEGLETFLRAELSRALQRGNVTLSLRLTRSEEPGELRLNPTALAHALDAVARIEAEAVRRGLALAPTRAGDLLALRGLLDAGADQDDTAPLLAQLKAELPDLIAAFRQMRATEGRALAQVLGDQLDRIAQLTETAAALAEARKDGFAATLRANLDRVLANSDGADPDRVAQELALIVVKTDVTEEIDRLRTHVDAARKLLADGGAVGRKLDFLMQEFNRETNTLCSKAQMSELTAIGLDLKAVIDQMREQVQNVE